MRLLLRKKSMMSKKILQSRSGMKTLKLMKNLENIEKELEISYKTMRIKKEKEALHKIKRNPKFFYKYASKFSKTRNRVGPLINKEGETVKDPYYMGELLRKQYESTFSSPDTEDKMNNDEDDDTPIEEVEKKRVEDNKEVTAEEDEDINREGRKKNEEICDEQGPPELYDVPFDYMDIVEAIDQLSECSGPGPDGISAILLKKSKISVALMLWNIFQHSLEKGDIPAILKMGFICPILKPSNKREKAASWRPVSITSHVMKTMERVVRKRIVNHLEMNNLIRDVFIKHPVNLHRIAPPATQDDRATAKHGHRSLPKIKAQRSQCSQSLPSDRICHTSVHRTLSILSCTHAFRLASL